MGFSCLQNIRIAGLATAVPKRNLDNVEYGLPEFEEERVRFVRNVGVSNVVLPKNGNVFLILHFVQLLN